MRQASKKCDLSKLLSAWRGHDRAIRNLAWAVGVLGAACFKCLELVCHARALFLELFYGLGVAIGVWLVLESSSLFLLRGLVRNAFLDLYVRAPHPWKDALLVNYLSDNNVAIEIVDVKEVVCSGRMAPARMALR